MATGMHHSTPDAAGFLDRVRERPDDDGPRLILADWLDEHGDPRGAFIRVQVALARLPEDDARRGELVRQEQDLLARYSDVWAAPLRGIAAGPVFRRGIIEEANVTARQFLANADALFGAAPIRHVQLLDVGGHLPDILASAHLTRLTGLTMFAQHFDPKTVRAVARAVAEAPTLAGLRVLRLGRNRLGDAGAEALVASPHFAQLEELDLSENDIGDVAAKALAESPNLAGLRRLELAGNGVGPAGAEAVAASDRRPPLERLGLAGNRVGGPRLLALDRPGAILGVTALNLAENGIGPDGLAALLAGCPAADVRELNLSSNELGDDGARALAEWPGSAGLRVLRLTGNGIGNGGLAALAASAHLGGLAALDLSNNPITDDGFRALLGSRHLRGLRKLVYPGIGVSYRMRLALDARFNRGAVPAW